MAIPAKNSEKVFTRVGEIPPKLFRPVGDQIAVHMHPVPENEHGILLPDGSENPIQSNICTVIAVGADVYSVEEGDQVLLMPVMAPNIYHKGYKYIMVKEEQVAGVIVQAKDEQEAK